ncbi:MAG: hypothetical protein J5895_04070 [Alphaproteobacteria bacterium]|nr:hypothetical protein [Alphaproteobacteria bacterium]
METFDFLIEMMAIFCVIVVLGCGIAFLVVSAAKKQKAPRVPSGKYMPEDKELLVMNVERLQTFIKEDLFWLLEYAAMMKNQAIANNKTQEALRWDDLMRRIDIAIEEACL